MPGHRRAFSVLAEKNQCTEPEPVCAIIRNMDWLSISRQKQGTEVSLLSIDPLTDTGGLESIRASNSVQCLRLGEYVRLTFDGIMSFAAIRSKTGELELELQQLKRLAQPTPTFDQSQHIKRRSK